MADNAPKQHEGLEDPSWLDEASTAEDVAHLFSFDLVGFHRRIDKADDWAKIVHGHLFADHVLTKTLLEALPYPDKIAVDRMAASSKFELCQALGLMPPFAAPSFARLNRLRNKLSHDLDFNVEERHAKEIYDLLPDHWRNLHDDVLHLTGSRIAMAMKVVVVMLDSYRQIVFSRRESEKRRRQELENVVRAARDFIKKGEGAGG